MALNNNNPTVTDDVKPPITFVSSGHALVIGSHWDDILLGCLGTVLKLIFIPFRVEYPAACCG
jgi:hypothetical protein